MIELRPLSEAQLLSMGIAKIDETIFQLTSKSNPEQSYVIDLKDLKSHKSDCIAFKYGKECNHMKRLKEARLIKE